MRCERCDGLMVVDHLIDLESSGELWLSVWRCANCGNVVDTQIRRYRVQQPAVPSGPTCASSGIPSTMGQGMNHAGGQTVRLGAKDAPAPSAREAANARRQQNGVSPTRALLRKVKRQYAEPRDHMVP
jgi:hypothetical protein